MGLVNIGKEADKIYNIGMIVKVAKIFQAITYWPFLSLFKLFLNFRVLGQENLKGLESGPIIFASNHASFFDSPIAAAVVPRDKGDFYPKKFFPIRFLAGSQFFRWYYLLVAFYVYFNGSIKIIRGSGQDLSTILADAVTALKNNNHIWIFPEGGITEDGLLHPGKRGITFLQQATGAPIVPVAIRGTWKMFSLKNFFRRKNVVAVIGQPIYSLGEVSLLEGSEKVMKAIANLYNKND